MEAIENNIRFLSKIEPHTKYRNILVENKDNVTIWYDFKTGEMKAIGENYTGRNAVRTRFEVEDSGILPFIVPFHGRGPRDEETGLIVVLDSIMNYRTNKFNANQKS